MATDSTVTVEDIEVFADDLDPKRLQKHLRSTVHLSSVG